MTYNVFSGTLNATQSICPLSSTRLNNDSCSIASKFPLHFTVDDAVKIVQYYLRNSAYVQCTPISSLIK